MSEFHALFKISGPNLDRDEITVAPPGIQIGRSGDNDLTLPHSEISRHHMRLFPYENGFAVEDLKSSNGVWVNDVRIRVQTPHPIKPGDILRAGPFLFTFERIIEVGAPEPLAPAQAPEPQPLPPEPDEFQTAPPVMPPESRAEQQPEPQQEQKPEPTPEPEPESKATRTESKQKRESTPEPDVPRFMPPDEVIPSEPAPPEPVQPPVQPPPPPEVKAPPVREFAEPIQPVERVSASDFIPGTPGQGLAHLDDILPDRTLPPASSNGHANGHTPYPVGIPTDASNWLKYLPAIYSEDDFLGRYLLVFESIMSPLTWMVDNFDLYLSYEVTSSEWLRWIASWFDVMIVPDLPIERQRAIVEQLGWLFSRRGTRAGLERLLTLYYGVKPEIVEQGECHFIVRMPLSDSSVKIAPDVLDRLIMAHKPAHASYQLEII